MFAAVRRKLLFCLIAGIYLFPAINFGQESAEQIQVAKHLTTVPFTMLTGGIVIIRASLDSFSDSLNFILDTGSGGISLDSSTCSRLGIKLQHTKMTIRGIAGIRTVDFAYGHTLNLPGLAVSSLDFHVNDYNILTSVYGLKIDGIVGYSFFRRYIVKLNYDKNVMDVLTTGAFKYPHGGTLLKPQFSTLAMQSLYVKDLRAVTYRFFYDMGAGLCMLLSRSFVEDSAVLKTNKRMFETQAQGLGGKAEMSLTVLQQIRIGP